MTLAEAPTPVYPSRRLIGPEVEIDAGAAAFHEPELPSGWSMKSDGSLRNGKEFVLEPPQPLGEALPSIDLFSAAVTKAKMHVAASGGFHVHVQVADYAPDDAYRLCQLYHHFQRIIDLTVGASRRSSINGGNGYHHCATLSGRDLADLATFKAVWHLDRPASDRQEAKGSRLKVVVNCAMMRTRDPLQRTVEFRQPSTSKHTANIYGWICMATALVDAAKLAPTVAKFLARAATLTNYLRLMRHVERHVGAAHLADWVIWRIRYLTAVPGTRQQAKLLGCLAQKQHGLFHVARVLNVNLAVAKKMVDTALAGGGIVEISPGKYRAGYASMAEPDLKSIVELWTALETPAQIQAVA